MQQYQQEQPLYILPQKRVRALVPKILSLIVLGAIFYVGILLNLSLLELESSNENLVKIISIIVVACVIILGIVIALLKSKEKFIFYRDRLVRGKKSVSYSSISNTNPHIDLFDKIFKTYSINLDGKFHVRHIPNEIQIQGYIQKLQSFRQGY